MDGPCFHTRKDFVMPHRPTQTNRYLVGLPQLLTLATLAGLSIEQGDYITNGPVSQVRLTLKDVSLAITDVGSTGRFSNKLFDFPKGVIQVIGAVQDLSAVPSAGGNIQIATGTAADTDGTLAGTEVNLTAASTAAASAADSVRTAAPAGFDGSSTAVAAFLNGVTAGDPSSGATVVINGTITYTWINAGITT
jgi:hypothetical protein